MLKLNRRPGQKIVITDRAGERMTIAILESYDGICKMAFDASENFTIHREEIQNRIDKERKGSY